MQNWKKHKKKTLFVNTPVLTVLVKVSVFFLHFSFLPFLEFPCFSEMFLIGFQKSNNNKIWKQQQERKTSKTKIKNKTQIQKWETQRKEERTIDRERERQRTRKWKRRRPQKAKKKQRETQKNEQRKCPFLGGKTGFFFYFVRKSKKAKTKKNKKIRRVLGPSEVALWATSPDP